MNDDLTPQPRFLPDEHSAMPYDEVRRRRGQTRLFAEYSAERCLKAEAEIDRLRAELAACYSAIQVANDRQEQAEETLRVADDSLFRAVEDAQKAEAAIARVRFWCQGLGGTDVVTVADVLRALDGGK